MMSFLFSISHSLQNQRAGWISGAFVGVESARGAVAAARIGIPSIPQCHRSLCQRLSSVVCTLGSHWSWSAVNTLGLHFFGFI